ncbi:MBOAT family protein [Candidatus Woesearchaeota archaeon]|nr:MBOAT family protein [Candidatus Woesearchaeota archaeon]
MQFNSIHFLIFFPIIVLLYFNLKHKYRWILLLLGSYYFYMSWKPEYIILIMISTLIDYIAGLRMSSASKKAVKKAYLVLSLSVNLGLLFAFKYFNFFSEEARQFLAQFSFQFNPLTLQVLLPIGISFYTFQTLSYTIDVYRGKIRPERHLGIFAVYVSYFPQLVAGPIERAKNLLPQFYEKHSFDYTRIVRGLQLMLWGFFKKIVIADNLALFVNHVYGDVGGFNGLQLILATVFFGFQIYCDFSGYSDIAIGAAQVMGFRLMDNFKRPYSAVSIRDFWKRWHISLTSWFKDYFYIPLGGNKVSVPRWYVNILLVFLVSGLWHGANWTFLVWGGLHGFFLVFALVTKGIRERFVQKTGLVKVPFVHHMVRVVVTFSLVTFGWIFFRAESISQAWYIVTHLFSDWSLVGITLGQGVFDFWVAIFAIVFLEIVHLMQSHQGMRQFMSEKPAWMRWAVIYFIILAIILFGEFGRHEFIYFQF